MQDFIPTTLSSTGVLFSPTPAFQDSSERFRILLLLSASKLETFLCRAISVGLAVVQKQVVDANSLQAA